MTVRTNRDIIMGPQDFVRTTRGVTWGLKVTDGPDDSDFTMVLSKVGDAWVLETNVVGLGWEADMKAYPNIRAWAEARFLPALNQWLAAKFPVSGAVKKTVHEELDTLIFTKLRITENADGTVVATLDP